MPVHTIDLQYRGVPGVIAAYLVEGPDAPVLIECGPTRSADQLVAGLAAHGLEPGDLAGLLVTHIHLDHAGAAGWLAARGVDVHVHEFGVKHLVDPAKLVASATRIYGDMMDELWGAIDPCPGELVHPVRDGDRVRVGGLEIEAIETPGHARHHHAFALEVDGRRVAFVGDAGAMIVPETNCLTIPTPPPEFDLPAWLTSIDRLEAEGFETIYPTHFGAVDDVRYHWRRLRPRLLEMAAVAHDALRRGDDDEVIVEQLGRWMRERAVDEGLAAERLAAFVPDSLVAMNAVGLCRYWRRQMEASEEPMNGARA
jgi:glyoxylase-like metal-dependent hydrolase (beta-lactamase superfamily II)